MFTRSRFLLDPCEWSAVRPDRFISVKKATGTHVGQEAGWGPQPISTLSVVRKIYALLGRQTPITVRPARGLVTIPSQHLK